MKKIAAVAFVLLFLSGISVHAAVTFDWATVGNPGNGPDDTGFGAVSYIYRISKHEVTNAQYTEFLNAVDPTGSNTLALYNSLMSSDANGGINLNGGGANGSKYQLKSGRDNNPVIYVSYFDSMRFTNWLQNGQGGGSTESGVYTIGNGFDEIRNPSSTYFITSDDEWYKSAYHKNDGVTGNYWEYPTSTDAVPYSDQPPGNGAPTPSNTANFARNDGIANGYDDGYAVTGATTLNTVIQNYLTDVGAYTTSLSPYGTFDQGSNVWEWNEAVQFSSFRSLRGGDWAFDYHDLSASIREFHNPAFEGDGTGFCVASIPADLNQDGRVDGADAAVVYNNWGSNLPVNTPGNIDGDTNVDGADIAAVYSSWTGDTGPVSGVPEPASALLASCGIVGFKVFCRKYP